MAHVKTVIPEKGKTVNKDNEIFFSSSKVLRSFLFQVKGKQSLDPFNTVFQWDIQQSTTPSDPRDFKIRGLLFYTTFILVLINENDHYFAH